MSGMTIKKGNGKQLLLSLSLAIQKLSGSLSKSGPLHFGSEKSFPSNFSQ